VHIIIKKSSAAHTIIVNTAHAQAGYIFDRLDSAAAAAMVCITPARRDVLFRQREIFFLLLLILTARARARDQKRAAARDGLQ